MTRHPVNQPTPQLSHVSAPMRKAVLRALAVSQGKPLKSAVLARLLGGFADQIDGLSGGTLSTVASAQTLFELVLSLFETKESIDNLRADNPLAAARLRAIVAERELLGAEGGLLSSQEVAEFLGISRQAVDKRRRAGKLLAFSIGRRGYRYPAWQLDKKGVLAGLPEVLATLEKHDPWMQATFFLNGNHRTEGHSPLEALRQGRVERVIEAAHAFGEHGAA